MASQEWHLDQATKYAIEGIKTALLLNGAAAIALMTFANTRQFSGALITPLYCFAIGALLSTIAFFCASQAQVVYGNASRTGISEKEANELWVGGSRWTIGAIVWVTLSLLAFFVGIYLTGIALPKLVPMPK
jgi:hypothetical protein